MGLFFHFKRFVGIAAQPLPVIFGLGLLALLLLLFAKKRRPAGVCLFLAGLVLFVASFPPLVRWQAGFLEGRHQPLTPARAAGMTPWAVVVLGNGVAHPGDRALPALTRLNDCARARLVEGVRLAQLFPDAMLVTCGYGMGMENCADAMALAAMELGVDASRIRRLTQALDTAHEARLVRDIAGGRETVLVTSAAHMPRAFAAFENGGVRVTAAPCDFIAPPSEDTRAAVDRWRWRPRGSSLTDSGELWHEYLGLLYQRFFAKSE